MFPSVVNHATFYIYIYKYRACDNFCFKTCYFETLCKTNSGQELSGKSSESVQCAMLKACDVCALRRHGPVIAQCTDSEDFPAIKPYPCWWREGTPPNLPTLVYGTLILVVCGASNLSRALWSDNFLSLKMPFALRCRRACACLVSECGAFGLSLHVTYLVSLVIQSANNYPCRSLIAGTGRTTQKWIHHSWMRRSVRLLHNNKCKKHAIL